MKTSKVSATLIIGLALGTPGIAARGGYPIAETSGQREARIAAMRTAGLKGDRSQIPSLLTVLKDKKDTVYILPALHVLAQLGAQEALPAIEEVISDPSNGERHRIYAQVVRARLLAERDVKSIDDPDQRARMKLRRFLDALTLDVEQLSQAQAKQKALRMRRRGFTIIEIHSLRELADMIYKEKDTALRDAAYDLGIDFAQDAPAALKVRVAPLSQQTRVKELIEELADRNALTENDYYTIQLAVDEGVVASRAAAAKLQEMKTKSEQTTCHAGFAALFFLISGVGDREQAPVVAQFLNDSNRWIAHYAGIAYPDIREGIPKVYAGLY